MGLQELVVCFSCSSNMRGSTKEVAELGYSGAASVFSKEMLGLQGKHKVTCRALVLVCKSHWQLFIAESV
jgi:hypothetical protein